MTALRQAYKPIDLETAKVVAWPDIVPKMTDWEAVRAASRLWRFALGESCPFEIKASSGNRSTWLYDVNGVANYGAQTTRAPAHLRVNPDQGWREFIHDLSHLFADRANGREGHSKFHAKFEAKLIREVIRRGWLEGKLKTKEAAPKPAPTGDALRMQKVARADAAIKRWTTKAKRAETALRKLNRSRRALLRALSKDAK